MVERKYLVPFLTAFGLILFVPTLYKYIRSRDAEYSTWSPWSNCMSYCGPSWQGRTRSCVKTEIGFGRPCVELGPATETRKCNLRECPIDGRPDEWGKWEKCAKDCKDGVRFRRRHCNNPAPSHYGLPCQEALMEEQPCPSTKICPVDGELLPWSDWPACSVTCGQGAIHRTRNCTLPQHGGKPCSGPLQQGKNCNLGECPKKEEPKKEKPADEKKTEKKEDEKKTEKKEDIKTEKKDEQKVAKKS